MSVHPFRRPARARLFRLAVVAASAPMLLAACSAGSSGSADPTTTAAPGPTSTSAAPTTTTIPITAVFPGFSAKTATADVKITYASALGPAVTLSQNGAGESSFVSNGNLLISDGTRVIRCNGTTAAATCSDLGPAASDDALTQLISTYAGLSTLKTSSVGTESTQTIAGRVASCVTFKASDYVTAVGGSFPVGKLTAAATVTVCVDDDSGFAVKIALTDHGNSVDELVATAIGNSSPADFVPPSPAVPLPAGGTSTSTPTTAG